MEKLTVETLEGSVDPKVAHAVVALQNIKLRALEVGRRLRESEELEGRLAELEEAIAENNERSRAWG